VLHPDDPGLWLGNLAVTAYEGPAPVDAVVSLCRVGTGPILMDTDVEHHRVWLVDKDGQNANLHYAMDQAAREVLRLRREGKRVLLHCVAGESRTPAIAAIYSFLAYGTDPGAALHDLHRKMRGRWRLPAHMEMHDAVYELTTGDVPPRKPRKRSWRSMVAPWPS
jgi:protein-tyrosine phosphatase